MTTRLEATVKGSVRLDQAHLRERMQELGDELRQAIETARKARRADEAARLKQKRAFATLDNLRRTDARYRDAFKAWDTAWGEQSRAEHERIKAERELHRIAGDYRDLIDRHELLGRDEVYRARLEEAREVLS